MDWDKPGYALNHCKWKPSYRLWVIIEIVLMSAQKTMPTEFGINHKWESYIIAGTNIYPPEMWLIEIQEEVYFLIWEINLSQPQKIRQMVKLNSFFQTSNVISLRFGR